MINSTLLTLCPLSVDDSKLFVDIYTNKELMTNIGPVFSKQQALKSFKYATENKNKNIFYIIKKKHNNNPIGIIGLMRMPHDKSSFELGIMILNQFNGRGYAYKATHMLLNYAFSSMHLKSILVFCHINNHGANRISESLGFNKIKTTTDEKTNLKNIHWEITFEQFKQKSKR